MTVVDLEERLAEFFQDPFQVAEVRALVDDQALDLVEHRRVGLVRVDAIGAARDDDADRRLLRHHGADLHRRGVRAQQQPRAVRLRIEEERVVHVPRRMAFGKVELGEIVIVGLDVGTFRHRKAHVGEDRGQLVDHLADRMNAPGLRRRLAHRQRHVDGLGGKPRIERRALERVLARRDRRGHLVLEPVDRRALLLALVLRHAAERLEQCRDRTVLAERGHAHGLEAASSPAAATAVMISVSSVAMSVMKSSRTRVFGRPASIRSSPAFPSKAQCETWG